MQIIPALFSFRTYKTLHLFYEMQCRANGEDIFFRDSNKLKINMILDGVYGFGEIFGVSALQKGLKCRNPG